VLLHWLSVAVRGDAGDATELCFEAANDTAIPRASRDLLFAIAFIDRTSLTHMKCDDAQVAQARELALNSEVPLVSVAAALGLAWSLAETAPAESMWFLRRAMRDVGQTPMLTRHTLPGNASRLLARLDPPLAAEGLIEMLDQADETGIRDVEYVPVLYAVDMLRRIGDPIAERILCMMSPPGTDFSPTTSMMEMVELAHQWSTQLRTPRHELDALLRTALTTVARSSGSSSAVLSV
jgi:hypothetical protein